MSATYTKLKDGTWGLRIVGAITATVTVRKKSGEEKQERVGRVLWSGNGITLATIQFSRQSSGGEYCGYACPVTGRICCRANGPCHDCE